MMCGGTEVQKRSKSRKAGMRYMKRLIGLHVFSEHLRIRTSAHLPYSLFSASTRFPLTE